MVHLDTQENKYKIGYDLSCATPKRESIDRYTMSEDDLWNYENDSDDDDDGTLMIGMILLCTAYLSCPSAHHDRRLYLYLCR